MGKILSSLRKKAEAPRPLLRQREEDPQSSMLKGKPTVAHSDERGGPTNRVLEGGNPTVAHSDEGGGPTNRTLEGEKSLLQTLSKR